MKDYWANKGYQPYEPVRGFIDPSAAAASAAATAIRKPDSRINIERRGLFGQCTDLPYMSFMDSLDVEECGFDQIMSADFCQNTLSAKNILDAWIFSTADLADQKPLRM